VSRTANVNVDVNLNMNDYVDVDLDRVLSSEQCAVDVRLRAR
jgi:hypothetical protein